VRAKFCARRRALENFAERTAARSNSQLSAARANQVARAAARANGGWVISLL